MTDDLDTLLRDAGRGPTTDLDVDAVHSRARRRTLVRRAASGIGVLALVGVFGVGVASLLDAPDVPVVDQAPAEATPSPTPSPSPDASETAAPAGRRTPTAAMADLGVTVVDVVRSHDGAAGLDLRVVTEDGVVEEYSTAAGGLPPLHSQVVVTDDLRVWFNDADPNLLVGGPGDPVGGPGILARDGLGWVVLGESEAGLPLITQDVGIDEQFPADFEREVLVFDEGDEASGNGSVTGIPGIFGTFRDVEGQPFAADAVPEHLALLHGIGESSTVTLHPAGGEPIVLAETGGLDSWFVDVAFVEDQVWVAAAVNGQSELWIAATDGSSLRRLAAPVGRGEDADAFVVDLQAQEGRDGWVVTLSTATDGDENGSAWVVDVDAARAAATEGELGPDASVVAGVFDLLDAEGHVHLLPPSDPAPTQVAACAGEPGFVNARPESPSGHLWFLCWDAVDQLPDGVAHPYVATERFTDGEATTVSADVLGDLLLAWADGPTGQEAAAGLTGGVDPMTAAIAGVTIEGTQVTVDLSAGPQVGVLGTTTGRATFVQQVAGTALQHDDLSTLRITLDGSCEDWAALAETEGCPTYDERHTPWAQGAGAP